tara:strand:- start:10738 stop:11994 length:1257 start_codon:yes stop_codon:yes gene_type:complete
MSKNKLTVQYFYFPSYSRNGLWHNVMRYRNKGKERLLCTCDAWFYQKKKPEQKEFNCSHKWNVRLGEAALYEPMSEIDVLVTIVKDFPLRIITLPDEQRVYVRQDIIPGHNLDMTMSFLYRKRSEFAGKTKKLETHEVINPNASIIDEIIKLGYKKIGIFFDPTAKNIKIRRSILRAHGPHSISDYMSNLLGNGRKCFELRDERITRHGIIDLDTHNISNLEWILMDSGEKKENKDSKPETHTRPAYVNIAIKELQSEISDFLLINKIALRNVQHELIKLSNVGGLPKSYTKLIKVDDVVNDLFEDWRRKRGYKEDKESRESYKENYLKRIPRGQVFSRRVGSVKNPGIVPKNIAQGFFIRNFLTLCYQQLGKEVPDRILYLPTHLLKKIYLKLTERKVMPAIFSQRALVDSELAVTG